MVNVIGYRRGLKKRAVKAVKVLEKKSGYGAHDDVIPDIKNVNICLNCAALSCERGHCERIKVKE